MDTVTDNFFLDDFSKYPTIESLIIALEKFKLLDFSKLSVEEIKIAYGTSFEILPSLISYFLPETFNKFNFYRVRLNIKDEYEDLGLIQTYSYPPPEFCKENGRANIKNETVFYCSNCALTAILESKPKVGDIGYLSIWKGYSSKQIKAGTFLPRNLKRENIWRGVADDVYAYADTVAIEAKDKAAHFQELLNFVANCFIKEKPPYSLTSWISHEMIYGKAWKDLIIYPSFVNNSYSSNVAIHPNVVHEHLQFIKVIKFRVDELTLKNIRYSIGRVGEIVNDNMFWRPAAGEELDFTLLPL